jgi:hypothetical protein
MAADITKPQTNSNSGFGLPKGEFKPIETTENRKWLRITLIIAGIVLLIGAGTIFWLFRHPSGYKDLISSTSQTYQEEDALQEETSIENEKKSGSNDETFSELKELSEDFTRPIQEGQEPSIMVINAPTGLYYVIISSYIDTDLAIDYAKKLSKKGVHSKIITPKQGQHFVRLSVAQAPTLQEARQKANELKAVYGSHVWIMKY